MPAQTTAQRLGQLQRELQAEGIGQAIIDQILLGRARMDIDDRRVSLGDRTTTKPTAEPCLRPRCGRTQPCPLHHKALAQMPAPAATPGPTLPAPPTPTPKADAHS